MKNRLLAVFSSAILTAGIAHAQEPMRPGTELFVDDANLIHRSGMTRKTHACIKPDAPVIVGDTPWENNRSYMSGLVVRDAQTGNFRMWYGASGRLAYATSRDGLKWEKPLFSFVPHKGQPTNALVKKSNMISVLWDIYEKDPEKRYKALASNGIHEGGFYAFYSADGIEWKPYPGNPLIPYGSEMSSLMRDPQTKEYFAYIRPYTPRFHPTRLTQKRLGAVTRSKDFATWTNPETVLVPDKIDDAWCTKQEQRTEFYAMNGFPYGNSWLGVVPLFRITAIIEKIGKDQSKYEGPLEGQLITSRDGLKWNRMTEREPVIPSGSDFDISVLHTSSTPLVVGDEVWMYYTGISATHGAPAAKKKISVCLAKWRLDGFASLDSGDAEGEAVTTGMQFARPAILEVNADASRGSLMVEVLDARGNPLPGYGAADVKPVSSDKVRHIIEWKHGRELPAGVPCMLRFKARNTSLYSYTLKPVR